VKWRCEWCGKPHAENDPPCDNCGHGEFEKAVVPAAPEGDDQTSDAYGYVWVCTECGNDHPKNTPPCDRCGHTNFERQENEFDEEEVLSEMLDEGSGGGTPSADVSYLDVLDAKLVVGFVAVAIFAAVFALGFLGIFDPLGLFPGATPSVDAPGNDTQVGSLDLATVESAYVERLNDHRAEQGASTLTVDEDVTAGASYVNRKRVQSRYGEETTPSGEVLADLIGDSCEERPVLQDFEIAPENLPDGSAANYDSEAAFADALITSSGRQETVEATVVGVDVHVGPDETVFVTQLLC